MRFLYLICYGCLVFSCTSDASVEVSIPVASWQEITVDLAEFEDEYMRYASMAPIQDSPEHRIEYAYVMLERQIIDT